MRWPGQSKMSTSVVQLWEASIRCMSERSAIFERRSGHEGLTCGAEEHHRSINYIYTCDLPRATIIFSAA